MVNHHYRCRHDKFISYFAERAYSKGMQSHHITPVCMGGSDDESNLVWLTCREHCIAHWLHWKAFGGRSVLAFRAVSNLNGCKLPECVKLAASRDCSSYHTVRRMMPELRFSADGISKAMGFRSTGHMASSAGVSTRTAQRAFNNDIYRFKDMCMSAVRVKYMPRRASLDELKCHISDMSSVFDLAIDEGAINER